ncbi:uncharacterized protein LAESUDRAFT_663582 [Laetiporus sulphureus 93-53]|uniref:Wax synthase domain-containing protein n=1 Tax=Laetiporus sulphureus 93-53 TaxID=1314785 RepID=A0A165BTD5_9APHY|nr:uncharacterized protein LAESUDRAFT_663582 [Laetiporus sulphureus 93-53]KZT01615.1 hypothetical protein LAESUDRAFT_663582 [Laetiporus sulphureus 93-53]
MELQSRPLLRFVPFVILQHVLLACLIAIRMQRRARIVAFLSYFCVLVPVFLFTTGDIHRNHSTGCMVTGQIFTAFHLLCLSDPLNDFRHEREEISPSKMPYLRRVYWALCVICSPRGVGWNYQVANVPSRSNDAKWTFVRLKLLSALRWFLLIDFAQSLQRSRPLLPGGEMDVLIVAMHGCIQRFITIALIDMQYALCAAAFVALGISEPKDWPDLYGQWSDACTVRRFWGRAYHQMIRQYTTSIGKLVCHLFRLQPGSWMSSRTQLYAGFAVSGLMHSGGDLMVSPSLLGASFPFYFSQAFAISFEDAVISAARRSKLVMRCPQTLLRCVGYAWVLTWTVISAPLYLTWTVRAGISNENRVSFSLLSFVVSAFENS